MIQVSLIGVLVCLLAWIYIAWTRSKKYWERLGVPFIPPHPFLGNLTFLLQENASLWMRRVYETYKSPYVGIYLFHKPALMVNCPEIARNILVKDSSNFRDRFLASGSTDPIGALNLFTVKDPVWSVVRKRLTGVFTAAKLKSLQPLVISKANELIQRIRMEKSAELSLRSVFADLTTDIIGMASFGVACEATLTGDSPMRTVTKEFTKFSVGRGIAWCSIFFWPELVDLFRFSFFPKSAIRYFRKVFEVLVEKRKDVLDKREDPRDLLDALLKLREEKQCGDVVFTDDLIISQAAIFLQAGFETTAITLTMTIYQLAFNPEHQDKLYKELVELQDKKDPSEWDTQTLSELVYLNCVIKEILRLYPAMGWLDRVAANDYEVDDKLTIRAGTPVYVNAVGMHHDPRYFPNPLEFDPERFLPENEKMMTPFTYMPFGEGPRICIGLRFARMNIQHVLSRLIINFEIRPLPKTPKPSEIQLEKRSMIFAPGENLYVDFIPRNELK